MDCLEGSWVVRFVGVVRWKFGSASSDRLLPFWWCLRCSRWSGCTCIPGWRCWRWVRLGVVLFCHLLIWRGGSFWVWVVGSCERLAIWVRTNRRGSRDRHKTVCKVRRCYCRVVYFLRDVRCFNIFFWVLLGLEDVWCNILWVFNVFVLLLRIRVDSCSGWSWLWGRVVPVGGRHWSWGNVVKIWADVCWVVFWRSWWCYLETILSFVLIYWILCVLGFRWGVDRVILGWLFLFRWVGLVIF